MKYSVVTFGCRVNQADSLQIEEALRRRGGEAVTPESAQLVVVNSCSVTASADQGTRQVIRRVARANPAVQVIVTGCYASRCPDEVGALPNVVRVVDNLGKETFDRVLDQALPPEQGRFVDGDGPCGSWLQPGVAGRTAFTLRVQTGCDEPCSYCIIPQTRGSGRSRPLPSIVDDVRRAIEAGYKEVAITGVHLGSYGRDLGAGAARLYSLLEALAACPGDVLFRISSLEPMDCTPDIVALVAASPRLAPHFHLPLQHGSDAVLRAMRRPYTAAAFADLVTRIHRAIPWASIGTDLIVGFPGETEADVTQTVSLLQRLPLAYLHVFPYSDRPGTEASRLANRVPGGLVRERGQQLRHLGSTLAAAFRRGQRGSVRRALTVDDGRSAVTDNFLKVDLPAPRARNQWVHVPID